MAELSAREINDIYDTITDRLKVQHAETERLVEAMKRLEDYHRETVELIRQLVFAVSGKEISGPDEVKW